MTKIILKRPLLESEKAVLEKAAIKELVEFERFCRDNALWDEMAHSKKAVFRHKGCIGGR